MGLKGGSNEWPQGREALREGSKTKVCPRKEAITWILLEEKKSADDISQEDIGWRNWMVSKVRMGY